MFINIFGGEKEGEKFSYKKTAALAVTLLLTLFLCFVVFLDLVPIGLFSPISSIAFLFPISILILSSISCIKMILAYKNINYYEEGVNKYFNRSIDFLLMTAFLSFIVKSIAYPDAPKYGALLGLWVSISVISFVLRGCILYAKYRSTKNPASHIYHIKRYDHKNSKDDVQKEGNVGVIYQKISPENNNLEDEKDHEDGSVRSTSPGHTIPQQT